MGTAEKPKKIILKMNRLKVCIGTFLLLSILFFVSSCSKEVSDNNISKSTSLVENRKSDQPTKTIDCSGICSARDCYAKLLLQDGSFTCLPCSDCKMIISSVNPDDNYQFKTDMKKLGELFEKQIVKIHGSVEYQIDLVTFDHGKNSEFVKLDYQVGNDQTNNYSIAFYTELEQVRPVKGPIVVDCSGNCGTGSTAICTEVYNSNNGEIYCKCQSDSCKMTISE